MLKGVVSSLGILIVGLASVGGYVVYNGEHKAPAR